MKAIMINSSVKLIGLFLAGMIILNTIISPMVFIKAKAENGIFRTYDLSETEIRKIASLCQQEQGTARGAAAEASLMANLYELRGITNKTLYEYVRTCGWWAKAAFHMDKENASDAVYQAVKIVLTEGKRTVPGYINEHDYLGDISSCQNNGISFDKRDKSQYQQYVTVINNTMGAVYTFYCFPDTASDPFGYTSEDNRTRIGEGYYDFDTWELQSHDPVDSHISFNNYTLPTDRLEPGKPFGLYGSISSYPNLTRVWGGVYNSDGTPSAEFVDFNPGSTYCDMSNDIDPYIIFNHLDEGYYTYRIEATNDAGIHESIESEFRVGDPPLKPWYDGRQPADLGDKLDAVILVKEPWFTIRANADNNVVLQAEEGVTSEMWHFIKQDDGSYTIQNFANGLFLDAYGLGTENGTNVFTCEYNDGTNQKWFIYEQDGGYVIRAAYTDMVLDAEGAIFESGTNIQMYEKNDSTAQIFSLYHENMEYGNPKNCELSVSASINSATLSLSAVYVDEYRIYRSTDKKTWTEVEKTASKTYTDKGLKAATTYYYKVDYINRFYTVPSDVVSIKTNEEATEPTTEPTEPSTELVTTNPSTTEAPTTEPTTTVTTAATNSPFKGSGSKEDPYQISNKADLEMMRDLVNDTSNNPKFGHSYYIQTKDIDLENEEWIPIGLGYDDTEDGKIGLGEFNCNTRMFFGEYNGNGHYIRNLKVDGEYRRSGLFGVIRGSLDGSKGNADCNVSNLVVFGSVSNALDEAGGIAGDLNYGATIQNCAFIGDVQGKNRAGGIVGSIYAACTIRNSYHLGTIASGKTAGGIAGIIRFGQYGKDNENTLVENCYHAEGTVTGSESSGAIAGICQYYDGILNKVSINNCYSSSDSSANAGECGATTDTSMILRPSEMRTIASDLGDAFITDEDASINKGYPIFTWQKQADTKLIKYGDTNGDTLLDIMDVITINRYLLGSESLSDEEKFAADVDGNNVVDSTDSLIILKCVVELIDVAALPLS